MCLKAEDSGDSLRNRMTFQFGFSKRCSIKEKMFKYFQQTAINSFGDCIIHLATEPMML